MSDEKPRYNQNRRLKQARMQRQVRQSQRRLNRLRVIYKFFLIIGLAFLIFFLLKMPLKADNIHVLFDTIPFLL